MAYEQVVPGQPLINSALWIIPRMVQGMGLQTVIRRQGKQHLSPMEQKYVKPVELITGFRPCQWLVGYEWSSNPANDRSEEHTSELQSLMRISYAVFCLKKNNKRIIKT